MSVGSDGTIVVLEMDLGSRGRVGELLQVPRSSRGDNLHLRSSGAASDPLDPHVEVYTARSRLDGRLDDDPVIRLRFREKQVVHAGRRARGTRAGKAECRPDESCIALEPNRRVSHERMLSTRPRDTERVIQWEISGLSRQNSPLVDEAHATRVFRSAASYARVGQDTEFVVRCGVAPQNGDAVFLLRV